MPSRLTKDSKLSGGKNNVQHLTGRSTNWNLYNFKLDSGYKPKKSDVNFKENPFDNKSEGPNNKKGWWRTLILKIKKG
jgi:hypothetical protein